ncbi:MAG: DsbA family protein [Salibaculum sp.]|jgi:protein-disulfide isomerase|uniref:DsbA family protein n=1 Tax=Salibaculum sp. TaxID=2855480 RepID=UPI00287091E1|nr:DsbA family protein [Salibaculum sp.]MDR9428043.1 DsbA family protein [Salibaculum sp.]MDR9482268.1 DsbA family protein [Salibaculum sp.]
MRLTLAALALAATPALGLELDNMTGAEREAFRAEVRAYLLENPEVLMEAIDVLEQRQAEEGAQADTELVAQNRAALFEDGHSWVGGNPEGDITIVEFLDYRCGYCKRAHPEVAELISGDGNIRYIIKEFPILGDQSVLASRFAVAVQTVAGDEAYKLVSDALMTQRADVTEASLTELSNTLGLETEAIMAEMSSDAVNKVLQSNQLLAQRMQITGTPTFVFEDQMLRGYAPLDAMRQVVDEVRAAD